MFPEEFKRRIKNQGYIDSESLLKALEEPAPVSIRINPDKWDKRPVNAQLVSWCKSGYYIAKRPAFTFDPIFHAGCYYPQEASGMFLEQAIRQSADSLQNIRVLDLCGAPGGKSTLLSEIIGPDNLLVANEVIKTRASILVETITKWGSVNTLVTQNDPSDFKRLTGYFDIIAADVPCSGEGIFRNPGAVKAWSEKNALHCSQRQKRILLDIWPSLKENGLLVYSTCTFNPGENEENIKFLISKHEAESVRLDTGAFKGIEEIDFHGVYGYGFYPGRIKGEGFFVSVIRKKGKEKQVKEWKEKEAEMKLRKDDLNIAEKWSLFSKESLIRRGDDIFGIHSFPDEYYRLSSYLNIIKAGTKLFSVKRSDYLPSHELAMSTRLRKGSFPLDEVDLREAILYLKRDKFVIRNILRGWNILTYNGVSLGFFNNIGSRVNNIYPVKWRIRTDNPLIKMSDLVLWQ